MSWVWTPRGGIPVDKTRCCASVHEKGMGVRTFQCQRKGKVVRGGNLWCTQHDPERQKRAAEERQARWDRQYAARSHRAEFEKRIWHLMAKAGVTLADLKRGRVQVTVKR
jgi:predicted ATPase with chaperone activity